MATGRHNITRSLEMHFRGMRLWLAQHHTKLSNEWLRQVAGTFDSDGIKRLKLFIALCFLVQ